MLRQMWQPGEPGLVRGRGHQAGVQGAKRGPAPAHDIAIWVGGLKPRMLALIGRVADGWLPSYSYLENRDVLGQGNERIDEAARAAGREPGEIHRLTNVLPADADPQTLAGLTRDFGVSAFILMSDDRAEISRFAAVIAPQVRDLVAADRDQAGPQQAVPSGAMRASGEPAVPRPAASQPAGVQAGEILPPAPTPAPLRQLSSRRVWDEEKRPTLPARAAGETYTALGRRISDHFVGVHDYLRAELESMRTVAAQVLSGDLDPGRARSALNQMTMRQNEWTLNAYCAKYCGELTQHHSIEDTSILPHLRRSDPALSPVLDRLAEEHGAIHDLINQVDQAMVAFVKEPARGGPLLHDAIDLLTDSAAVPPVLRGTGAARPHHSVRTRSRPALSSPPPGDPTPGAYPPKITNRQVINMKAWQFTKVGEPLSLRDVAVPQPGPGQVLLDVKASGLCHSDVGHLDGTIPHLPFAPITLGTR